MCTLPFGCEILEGSVNNRKGKTLSKSIAIIAQCIKIPYSMSVVIINTSAKLSV